MNGIPVGLGTASFGTSISQEGSYRVLDKYASLGGRIIDTANNYAYWHPQAKGGESETVIGEWLERVDRSAFTIMTKIGSQPLVVEEGVNNLEGLSPQAVQSAVSKSLDRLKTDYIDILLAHHDDRSTPLKDTWEAFSELVASGRVRRVGISNYSLQRVAELAQIVHEYSLAPIDFIQMQYSVIDPLEGTDLGMLVMLDSAMKETLKRILPETVVFAYSPLLGGRVFEKTAGDEWPSEYDTSQNRKRVGDIQRKAEELGVSPSACVLKEIADQGFRPITSSGNVERLEANLKLFIG